MRGGPVLALFTAADAAVMVALVSAVVGPLMLLFFQGRRTNAAAQRAAHNTAPNGVDDSGPSPYDSLVASHEYMIGQIHAAVAESREAAKAAWAASAAIARNDRKTDALAARVEEGFIDAKAERGLLGERLQANIDGGRLFAELVAEGSLSVLGRLDELDGGDTARLLRERLEEMGLVLPPAPEAE